MEVYNFTRNKVCRKKNFKQEVKEYEKIDQMVCKPYTITLE